MSSGGGYTYWHGKGGGDAPVLEPALLSAEEEAATREAAAKAAAGASLWNAAGTWEERDWTGAASERLTSLLLAISEGDTRLTAVDKVSGDATCLSVRGKLRHGFELHASVKWRSAAGVDGTALVEFSRDEVCGGELPISEVKVDKASAKALKLSPGDERSACAAVKDALRPALLKAGRELDAALAARVAEQKQ